MQRLIHCIAFSSLIAMTGVAMAQPDGTAPSLDLETAITKAMAGNPSLKAAGYQLQIQDARIDQAGIKPRGQLGIEVEDVFGSGTNDMLEGIQATASVTWVLERGVRASRVSAARARSSLIESDIAIQRLDVAAETARHYLESLDLQARLVIAVEGIELGAAAVTAIERRVDAGSAPAADLSRARADLRRQELIVEDIEHELLSAYYRLAAQWGANEPDFNRVLGNLLDTPTIETFTNFESRLDQNPDLERYLTAERVYEAQLRLEQASNRQPWRVTTGFRWLNRTSDHGFVAGLSIPLGPEDSNRGRVAEARARITQSKLEREAERLRLRTELFVLYQELAHSVHLTAAIEQDILPLYESALEQTQAAYEAGRYSYLEWSASQVNLLNARNDLVEAAHSILHNLIEIERLTGVSVEVPHLSQ
ncbi:MAG: TolC family protein [Proteobacteria bacterium]|nr:TolC family protein [Pseudomonadota bacterium]